MTEYDGYPGPTVTYRCPDCGITAVGHGAPLCECGKMMTDIDEKAKPSDDDLPDYLRDNTVWVLKGQVENTDNG